MTKRQKVLETSSMSRPDAAKYLATLVRQVDSIVVLGAGFTEDGSPGPILQARCDCERMIKLALPRYRKTILSGRSRGIAKFLALNPGFKATEASLMMRYCGPSDATYVQESLAVDTIGNIVFSSAWLIRLGLSRPLFISQATHLASRVTIIADHWFRGSGIRPEYWPIPDPDVARALAGYLAQAEEYYRSKDRNRGYGHDYQFVAQVPPISTASDRTALATVQHAVDWLYSEDGRYGREFGERKVLLDQVADVISGRTAEAAVLG